MIPTYVFGWPTGEEIGDYLALDLGVCLFVSMLILSADYVILCIAGGTNLRVCLVSLQGNGKFEITQTKYRLTEEQKHEDGEKLFDFCAECLQTFIKTNMTSVTEPGQDPVAQPKPEEVTDAEVKEGLIKLGQELPLGFTVRRIFQFFYRELTSTSVLLSLHVCTFRQSP